ncbi:MAG: ABC transporter permease [Planctomycetes bacterium]|nr:ABC transporter permease [Planctomycetota bacterium]
MREYIIKRLIVLPITLFGISIICFVIMHLAPGDPVAIKAGQGGVGGNQQGEKPQDRETYKKIEEAWDLDKPLMMQYFRWLARIFGLQVDVDGAKKVLERRTNEFLAARYREDHKKEVEDYRAFLEERRVKEIASLENQEDAEDLPEIDDLLNTWVIDVAAKSDEMRRNYAEDRSKFITDIIHEYGKDYEDEFWYLGTISLNRDKNGNWNPFDWGETQKGSTVMEMFADKWQRSVILSLLSIFLAYIIAIPLGIHSATHQFTLSDSIITTVLFILYSLPGFWVAIILLMSVSEGAIEAFPNFLKVFPASGLDSDLEGSTTEFGQFFGRLKHLALPVTCLTYASFAYISRQMRAGMLDVVRQDYIRTAVAKGLPGRVVIFKHALRNSLIPILTIVAFILPSLIGGSIIIETVFNIDGLGKLSFESINNRNYNVLMAIFMISSLLTLVGMLISDILYAVVNPTISFEGKK